MFWFRFARPRRSSTTLKRRRLNFEPLEDRRLLSVNVTNSGGAYTIASNSSADDVRVVAPGIGDVNYDGTVNGVDVSVWSSHYLSSGPVGDANYDGTVNGLDNTTIAGHWLQLSQIQIYDGATLNDTVPLLDITSLAINAAGGTIEIDGNFSRPVTVDGGSNATLDINGNPNRGDTVSMTDSSITLFDSTTTVSYSNIENINFALGGTSGSDLLTINGTSGDDSMQAQSDGSTIVFNGLNVNVASVEGLTLNGNDGDDTIDMFYLNSAIALTINGGAGDDLLAGGAGNDAINGGTGNNTLIGWGGNDTLNGGNGNATFLYMPGPASLGTDTLSIDSGGVGTLDFEYLTDGVTVNIGSTSTQSVVSGLLSLNLGTSTTIANVIGGAGNDTITGNSLSNVLDGRDGDDTITAGTGNAVMYGGAGDDTLTGGSGNDLLYGGAGDDTLAGGGGNDTYLFPWSPGDAPLGTDTITEASSAGTDKLDFSNFFPATYSAPSLSSTSTQTVGTDSSSNPLLKINLVNASTIESTTDSPISQPAVSTLAVNPLSTPGEVTLTAVYTGATVDPDTHSFVGEVDFYLDTNHDGVLETGTDTLLGTDTDGDDGWSINVPTSQVPTGTNGFIAVAVGGGGPPVPPRVVEATISGGIPNNDSELGGGGGSSGGSGAGGSAIGIPTLVRSAGDADVYADFPSELDAPNYAYADGGGNYDDGGQEQDILANDVLSHARYNVVATPGYFSAQASGAAGEGDARGISSFNSAVTGQAAQPGIGASGITSFNSVADANASPTGGPGGWIEHSGSLYSADPTDPGTVAPHVWTVSGNGAAVNGDSISEVTLAGQFTFNDGESENGAVVPTGTADAKLGMAFTVATSDGENLLNFNGGGETYDGTRNGGVAAQVVTNGTSKYYASAGNDGSMTVSFVWTVPVGTTISVKYDEGLHTLLDTGASPTYPATQDAMVSQVLYDFDMRIVSWSS
ncbi:MAG TPA: M10 family metallopeptidase C-terminal domain-containing protein [Pirellulales bacterium]|jgi:Ca2+-binding RTX toxin-like protein